MAAMHLTRRLAWLPATAWMAVIWRMSADSASGIKSLRVARWLWAWWFTPLTGIRPTYPLLAETDAVFRKGCHVGEYAVLATLVYGALCADGQHRPFPVRLRWAVWLTVGWAALDELHQAFVPGRGSHLSDVGIDSLGLLVLIAGVLFWRRWRGPFAA